MLAALLEVAVGVEARARRGEQHDLAGDRRRGGGCDRVGEPVAAAAADPGLPGRAEVALERSARLADQIARRAALGDRLAASPAKPPPFSDPPRIARTPPSNDRSAAAAAATLVAFESLT